jgi:sugar/nucleoside kinase (ribokinase family)
MNLVAFSNDHAALGMRLWEDSAGLATDVRAGEAAPVGDVFNHLPDSYRHARGFHFNVDLNRPDLQFAADLRRAGGLVSMSPFKPANRRLSPESLYKLISAADIFSLDTSEAESLVGPGSPRGLARRLVEAGESAARLIVLWMGEKGSWVVEGQTGQAALVPAFPVAVADIAGVGDAYCGGFLAGWIESHNLITAGLCGAVAASFAAGQTGLPLVTAELRAEARRRLAALEPLVETSSI